jgi:DNA-binding MarR family transcriptional regulator
VPKTTYDLSQRLPYLINRVGVAIVDRATDGGLRHFHLTVPMWRVMAVLAHRGELRQVDLAEATSLDAPAVSRLISSGVRRGLVTRTRSRNSNREVTVRLTKAGREIVDALVPMMVRVETALFKGVSAKELATFKKILRLMYANMADYHGNGIAPAGRGSARHKG